MRSKWRPNGAKIIAKLFQNDIKNIPTWYQNDPKIIQTWFKNDIKRKQKWSQNHASMIPTSCQNHAMMISKLSQNHTKIIFKWCQHLPKWYQNWTRLKPCSVPLQTRILKWHHYAMNNVVSSFLPRLAKWLPNTILRRTRKMYTSTKVSMCASRTFQVSPLETRKTMSHRVGAWAIEPY